MGVERADASRFVAPERKDAMDILEIIRTQYPNLSRAQKKIADYILTRPDDACFASLKELTEAVGSGVFSLMQSSSVRYFPSRFL